MNEIQKLKFKKKLQSENGFQFNIESLQGCKELEPYQMEKIVRVIEKYDLVAIKACHSVGKTYTIAKVALSFATSYKNSITIVTAPTNRQVEKLFWGEFEISYKNSKIPIGGRLLNRELKIDSKWFVMAFSPAKEAKSDSKEQKGSTFQGFHAPYMLVIFDEATGIHPDMWKMVEGILTSGRIVKFVCIGNPTTKGCEFFKLFGNKNYKHVTISCFDSPNLQINNIKNKNDILREVKEVKPLSPEQRKEYFRKYKVANYNLLSAEIVIRKAIEWGLDHPLFMSKFLAEFPDTNENSVIATRDIEMAINRDLNEGPIAYIGIDVARYGPDKSVFTVLRGTKQARLEIYSKRNTIKISNSAIGMIYEELTKCSKAIVMVDATGIGAGVFDNINQEFENDVRVTVAEVHVGQSPVLRHEREDQSNEGKEKVDQIVKRFLNLRARMFFLLSDDIKENIDLMDDEDYLLELPEIIYSYNEQGKIKIESKESFSVRTGRSSPDKSDSLALANLGRYWFREFGVFYDIMPSSGIEDSEDYSSQLEIDEY